MIIINLLMNPCSYIFIIVIYIMLIICTGTSYFQVHAPLLVISGMCVFSTASALFMFPAMYPYYQRALEVYSFEKADGVGKAYDLVIQGFIRFTSITFFPLIIAVTVVYLFVRIGVLCISCVLRPRRPLPTHEK